MNNFKVFYSKRAEADLDVIYTYIAHDCNNTKGVQKVLRNLTACIEELSFMADSYHFYPEEPYYSQGVRYFSQGKYSIFYKIVGDTAIVIRIVNGTWDLAPILKGIK